jgi:hypothetical protein
MYKSVNIKSIVYVINVEYVIDVVLMIVLLLLPSIGRRGSAPAQTRYIYIYIALGHSQKTMLKRLSCEEADAAPAPKKLSGVQQTVTAFVEEECFSTTSVTGLSRLKSARTIRWKSLAPRNGLQCMTNS